MLRGSWMNRHLMNRYTHWHSCLDIRASKRMEETPAVVQKDDESVGSVLVANQSEKTVVNV